MQFFCVMRIFDISGENSDCNSWCIRHVIVSFWMEKINRRRKKKWLQCQPTIEKKRRVWPKKIPWNLRLNRNILRDNCFFPLCVLRSWIIFRDDSTRAANIIYSLHAFNQQNDKVNKRTKYTFRRIVRLSIVYWYFLFLLVSRTVSHGIE